MTTTELRACDRFSGGSVDQSGSPGIFRTPTLKLSICAYFCSVAVSALEIYATGRKSLLYYSDVV